MTPAEPLRALLMTLRHDLTRECWKMHHANFDACDMASCVLARGVMDATGLPFDFNGNEPGVNPQSEHSHPALLALRESATTMEPRDHEIATLREEREA